MGSSTMLDLLGSMVIGSLLLLSLLSVYHSTSNSSFVYNNEYIIQKNLKEVCELLEYDFRKIAYCADAAKIPNPTKAILTADSNRIIFLTDVQSDGVLDTMKYYLGPASELPGTPNPRDRKLYRIVNGEQPKGSNMGVTGFRLSYFNVQGDQIPFPVTVTGEIYTIQIAVSVEDVAAVDARHVTAYWQQLRLAARNLRNR